MTQPKTDLAYLRNEKAKAEQKLRSCQHREKILERRMSELNRRERVHRLCTRAGMLESFLVCPGELTDDQVMRRKKDRSNGITALYERLSRDDDNAGESNSIVHQKQMLEDYAIKHGFTNLVHFTDDGWSGATFAGVR